jgi:4-amino-4-deoxy-L-arabinose transferase-like glycosyltransferase
MLVVFVLLVALFFRTYNVDRIPPGLDGDEMFNAWDALRVWEGHLAVYFPANYGREPLLIYLMALTARLLGVGPWTIRLASVLCGMVGILFTWSLARRLFSFRVAILAAALTSISLWPVLLNRVALRAGLLPACQVVAVYALWRALEDAGDTQPGSSRWAVAAGLFTGLSLYTYTSSRIFPLVLIFWLFTLHVLRITRHPLRTLALMGLVAGLVVLPLGLFALRHPEIFSQRVSALNFELNQILTGNLDPMWRSVRALLGMFTQVGAREWRYNPSGRPVFDPVTGALFYLGLIVSLFRLRRPAYLLLLIWLPVMLIPDVLSVGSPSFWRTVGALTPIYLMPAIGADYVWQWVARWSQRFGWRGLVPRLVPPVVMVAGLTLVGVDTWRDYFGEWARNPQVLHTYEADLAAAARYLNEYTPAHTPAWVSSEYPADLSRRLLKFQSTYAGPVRWFDGNHATVWPSGWAGQDVLLLFTRTSSPNPDALAVLGDYLIYREDDAAGRPHLWVYRVPGESLSEMPWCPAHALSGRFIYNRQILGYDAPAHVERHTEVPVVVYWRVPPGVEYDAADLPYSFVCLQDRAAGRCLKEVSHYMAYPLWDWTEGDVVAQRYMVPVPAYMVPQTTHFRIGMYTSRGEMSFADENRAGAPALIGPVEVVGAARVDPKWEADTPTFGQDLALLDHQVPADLSPGGALEVSLEWQAMRAPTRDYVVRLELRDRDAGDLVVSVEGLVGSGRHPTSRWVSGEPVHTFHRMQIPPDLGGGEFDVYAALAEAASGQVIGCPFRLGTVSISGRPHYFELPAPEHPLTADFEAGIRLLGFDLNEVTPSPGGQIEVVLYWQSLTTISEDYKVFVHLYHPTDDWISGQHDSPPGDGAFPTSSWLPGEVVTDPHLITIDPNTAVGVSKIGVGLYIPSTGERLSVQVDGQPQPDDVLIITEVEIQ